MLPQRLGQRVVRHVRQPGVPGQVEAEDGQGPGQQGRTQQRQLAQHHQLPARAARLPQLVGQQLRHQLHVRVVLAAAAVDGPEGGGGPGAARGRCDGGSRGGGSCGSRGGGSCGSRGGGSCGSRGGERGARGLRLGRGPAHRRAGPGRHGRRRDGSVFGQRGGPGGRSRGPEGRPRGPRGPRHAAAAVPGRVPGHEDSAQAVRRRLLHGLLAFLQEVTQEVEGQQAKDAQHALGEAEEPAVSAAPLAAPTQHRTDSETRAVRSHC